MATGIQTGMRTGTGMTPMQKPGGGSPFGQMAQAWTNLPSRSKTLYIILVLALVVVGVVTNFVLKANAYVALYDTALPVQDTQDITTKLGELGVPNSAEGGQIMVPPQWKFKARSMLAEYGLPRTQVVMGMDPASGFSGGSDEDKKVQQLQRLRAELINTIRSIDGVADAIVNIVLKDDNQFEGDSKPATAAVVLKLQPGSKLKHSQVNGIVHLVASSVKELNPKNVTITDSRGIILNDQDNYTAQDDESMPSKQLSDKINWEKAYTTKIQNALVGVLGQNKAQVAVDVTLDYSEVKGTTKTVGNPGGLGVVPKSSRTEIEQYGGGGSSAVPESGGQMGGTSVKIGKKNGANYRHETTVQNNQNNESTQETYTNQPRVVRLSASVLVNNLKPDQTDMIRNSVASAIGIDESRGDKVYVASMPFDTAVFNTPAAVFPAGAPAPMESPSGAPISGNMLAVMMLPVAVLAVLVVLFLLKQRSAQADKVKLMLATGPGSTVNDISDLLSDKVGRSTPAAATKVNTTEQLEKLAKEKPTKVAELLKSTWLAEKER